MPFKGRAFRIKVFQNNSKSNAFNSMIALESKALHKTRIIHLILATNSDLFPHYPNQVRNHAFTQILIILFKAESNPASSLLSKEK